MAKRVIEMVIVDINIPMLVICKIEIDIPIYKYFFRQDGATIAHYRASI